jgi:hypothetical protein
VLDQRYDQCRFVSALETALRDLRAHQELVRRTVEAERNAREAFTAAQRVRDEAHRRLQQQSAIAAKVNGCNLVGEGAFVDGVVQVQRLWLCADVRVVVENGIQVVYELSGLQEEFPLSLAEVRGAHLISLRGSSRKGLGIEYESACASGVLVLAWNGAALVKVLEDSEGEDCGSGDDGEDYAEQELDWWPPPLARPVEDPHYTLVSGTVRWNGEDAIWNETSLQFQPSPAAVARRNEELDEQARRLLDQGNPTSAFGYLRADAPPELRTRLRAACESVFTAAIERASRAATTADAEGQPLTDEKRAEWRESLADQGLRCAPGSTRLRRERNLGVANAVLLLARAGQSYHERLQAIDDETERRRAEERAAVLEQQGAQQREAERVRHLRDRQVTLTPERVLLGSWRSLSSAQHESYSRDGACMIGFLRCRYRWLGRPQFLESGEVRQVMLVQARRSRQAYQVVTSVALGADVMVHVSEGGTRYVYRRVP